MRILFLSILASAFFTTTALDANSSEKLFEIKGKTYTAKDLETLNPKAAYDIQSAKLEAVSSAARQIYLDKFFEDLGKKRKVIPEKAREDYLKEAKKVSAKEVSQVLSENKNNAQLMAMSAAQQRSEIERYLGAQKERAAIQKILVDAEKSGAFKVLVEKPKEVVHDIKILSTDRIRYSHDLESKDKGCGDKCEITVVEFSEFECFYCARTPETANRLMKEYKGRVRWINRDFPLDSIHPRARPAAMAAHCAADEGKYWHMYEILFKNQKNLQDEDLEKYAKEVGVKNMSKWKTCAKGDKKIAQLIEDNFQSGQKLGIQGTPGFFVNGENLSGAIPYEQFKTKFEEVLARKGK